MTTAMGPPRLIEQIGDLYLNEKLSDITIIVDGVELPAHSLILAQRCEYFQTMFECGLIESTSKRIEVRETSVAGFKTVLKWFYTGCIQLTSLDSAFKVLRLAHMYQITELIYEAVKYVWSKCTAKTACAILNESVLLSLDSLTEFVCEYVKFKPHGILSAEDFETLSTDALNEMLTRGLKEASDVAILLAVVRWMKASPTKSADFQNVLKNVPLTQITLKKLGSIPPEVLEQTNILAERARQLQTQKRLPHYQQPNKNVAFPHAEQDKHIRGCFSFKPKQKQKHLLTHRIGSSEKGIHIYLGRPCLINFITMNIVSDGTNFSYWVAVSEDNVNWTRVIDRTKYPSHGFQNLDFEPRFVRYIRIYGEAPDREMVITEFQALYHTTTMPFESDPETTLYIPPLFRVTFKNHTISVNGYSKPEIAFVDESHFGYDRSNHRSFGKCVYQLSETCLIDCLELMSSEWDCEDRVHSYDIEVSLDETNWTRVLCVDKVSCCRGIRFDKRPVKFIKISAYTLASPVNDEVATTKKVKTVVRLRRNQKFPIN